MRPGGRIPLATSHALPYRLNLEYEGGQGKVDPQNQTRAIINNSMHRNGRWAEHKRLFHICNYLGGFMTVQRRSRRSAVGGVMFAVAVTIATWSPAGRPEATEVVVYKNSSCVCCENWVRHLRKNGFKVDPRNVTDMRAVKVKNGVPRGLASCHTALVGGYVVEGHVPAATIKRLLKERPAVTGIAVPGMPIGSPGMEGPTKQPYKVLTFDAAGNTTVYEKR